MKKHERYLSVLNQLKQKKLAEKLNKEKTKQKK
jgi:hypothetical protein